MAIQTKLVSLATAALPDQGYSPFVQDSVFQIPMVGVFGRDFAPILVQAMHVLASSDLVVPQGTTPEGMHMATCYLGGVPYAVSLTADSEYRAGVLRVVSLYCHDFNGTLALDSAGIIPVDLTGLVGNLLLSAQWLVYTKSA